MTLNTIEIPNQAQNTEDRLRMGIEAVNKNHKRLKSRKKAVVRPKQQGNFDCSSLYPKGRVMIGAFYVTDLGGNKVNSTINLVCRMHGIDKATLLGETREYAVTPARRCLCVALRNGGWSLPRIGQLLNRDHTTVIHNLRRFKETASEEERENAAFVSEFFMNYDSAQSINFNNVRCLNELIAGQIAARVGYLKTRLTKQEMLANLQCLLAYLLHDIGFGFEEIAAVRDCEAKQIEGRCDYIENRCKHKEIHALKDQIIDRLAHLRGAA